MKNTIFSFKMFLKLNLLNYGTEKLCEIKLNW